MRAAGVRRRIATGALVIAALPAALGAQAPAPAPLRKLSDAIERAAAKRGLQRDANRYDDTFRKYSKRYFGPSFDWRLFKAQGMAESGLDPNARSWVGARGVMQLMPSTFRDIQSQRAELKSIDDPEWNIAAGIMHDRYLWRLWSRDVPEQERHRFMFGSYNAGEGTIARACTAARDARLDQARWTSIESIAPSVKRWRYRETIGYVRKIDSTYGVMQKSR